MEYLQVLRRLEEEGDAPEAGSAVERQAIDRVRELLGDFKAPDFRSKIRHTYAEELFFNDTLKTVRDVGKLEEYLAESADATEKTDVEFLDLVAKDGNYYFRWLMTIRFKKFAKGEDTRSIGMTHIRFDASGKVVLHQDYWDSTQGLFEHVPALGWMLRRIKNRL